MGGNVFVHERGSKEFVDSVLEDIEARFNLITRPIKAYSSKDSFGDIDIACVASPDLIIDSVECYGYDYVQNSNVVSVDWDGKIQVDFITFPTVTQMNLAADYYDFNDMGNLVGRLAHSIGLKYGHDGLTYIHREGTNVAFKMNLSENTDAIYNFLLVERKKEYVDLEDIFTTTSKSSLFHPNIYLLENRNHISRVRDRKRATYMAFLDWCKSHPLSGTEFTAPNKQAFLNDALRYFGKFWVFEEHMREHNIKKLVKEKFNGDIVMEVTGLQGKELGEFMAKCKAYLPDSSILTFTSETIHSIIRDVARANRL